MEMRFIDLFMAALGAVVFLAMLLAFLLGLLPGEDVAFGQREPLGVVTATEHPLVIAARSLPQGRVGVSYDFTLAHRGGRSPIRWHLGGETSQLPPGLRFDPREGRLAGTPSRSGRARLLFIALDEDGRRAEKSFDLVVSPGPHEERPKAIAFAVVAAIFGLVLWLGNRAGCSLLDRKVTALEQACEAGHPAVAFRRGPHEEETVHLPAGLGAYRQRLDAARRLDRLLVGVGILLSLWWTWHFWRLW